MAMPEGHVIHHLAAEIDHRFTGRVVHASSPQGRFTQGAALLDGRKVRGADAVGKHLFIQFSGAHWLHIHLGLYGRFTFGDGAAPAPVGQVRLRLTNRLGWTDLRGASACDLLDPGEKDAIEARLGDDPLDPHATGARAWARIHRSSAPIATLLMDQRVVAGSGNIFRAEVLFRAGVDPFMEGRSLEPTAWQAMWADFVDLMGYGLAHGRIDTVRPAHTPEAMGRPPRVDDHGGEVYVYRRDGLPCHVCGTAIRRVELAGRNLFWCPTCNGRA